MTQTPTTTRAAHARRAARRIPMPIDTGIYGNAYMIQFDRPDAFIAGAALAIMRLLHYCKWEAEREVERLLVGISYSQVCAALVPYQDITRDDERRKFKYLFLRLVGHEQYAEWY